MNSEQAVQAILAPNGPAVSPHSLSLLAGRVRTKSDFWTTVVVRPFADLNSDEARSRINQNRIEWNARSSRYALSSPLEITALSPTWQHASVGLLVNEARFALRGIRDAAYVAGGADAAAAARFDETQLQQLRNVSDQLNLGAQGLKDLIGPASKPKVKTLSEYFDLTQIKLPFNKIPELLGDAKGFVTTVGPRLGLLPNQVQGLTNFLDVTKGVLTTAVLASAGNYFGAVQALFGAVSLFGESSASGASANQYARISQALTDIFNELQSLGRQLDDLSREMVLRFEDLSGDLLFNRRLILSTGIAVQLNHCMFFLSTRSAFGHSANGFTSVTDAEAHCRATHTSYLQGRLALEAIFQQMPRFHEVFLRQSLEGQSSIGETSSFGMKGALREQVYQPVWTFVSHALEDDRLQPESVFEALLVESADVYSLRRKLLTARAGELGNQLATWRTEIASSVPLSLLLEDLLEPAVVDRIVKYLLDFIPYYDWVRSPTTGDFFVDEDWETALDARRKVVPRNLLLRALHLTDVSLAQQALISGDVALPWIARKWAPLSSDSQLGDPLYIRITRAGQRFRGSAVSVNSALARNLLLYTLKAQAPEMNAFTYASLLNSSNPEFLSNAFKPNRDQAPFQWDFVRLTTEQPGPGTSTAGPGWSVRLEELRKDDGDALGAASGTVIYVNLPSVFDFHKGKLEATEATSLLSLLRSELVDRLTGYDFNPVRYASEFYTVMLLGHPIG